MTDIDTSPQYPETELSFHMRQLHRESSGGLPENWLELAYKFDRASAGFQAEVQTVTVQQFMGHYARARRAWCNATGESLV